MSEPELDHAPLVLPPAPAAWRPIVAHIPHAATHIPPAVRAGIALNDAELTAELVRLTDHATDALFAPLATLGATCFVNRLSRLVVDPERFADDRAESMARVGQGAVYTRTADGRALRELTPAHRRELLARYFVPYHERLTALVAETVERAGECLILDCHSFGSTPLPSEPDQAPDRPDICIGTDAFHTPPSLVAPLVAAFAAEGFRVAVNAPFAGSFVPLRFYGTDARVRSVMIEVRRGLYVDEATGVRSADFDRTRSRLIRALGRGIGEPSSASEAPATPRA